jgi:nitronate monooxygenase
MELPGLVIKDFRLDNCIFQGGMGVGVSLHPLAGAVSREGGLGIVSSACLRTIVSVRDAEKVDTYTAVRRELERAQDASNGLPVGINVMCAVVGDYDPTVRAAIDAGVSVIVSGAGLPLGLPSVQPPGHTALIPIVSSARALELIVKRWEKQGYRPDAVVLEGPMAGGHLGFRMAEVDNPAFALELLLQPVLDVAHKYGDIPVIVAGGLYTHNDIVRFLAMGASGVQMATRFLATNESSATDAYKQAVLSAGVDDITVVSHPVSGPASPCGLPFRVLTKSPIFSVDRPPKCDKGYVLQRGPDGKLTECQATPQAATPKAFLCICNGLLSSAGYAPDEPPLYTVGSNAYRVKEILSVAKLMAELRGE